MRIQIDRKVEQPGQTGDLGESESRSKDGSSSVNWEDATSGAAHRHPVDINVDEIREIAARLAMLADLSTGNRTATPSSQLRPTDISACENQLAAAAARVYRLRRSRARHFPEGIFGEPAWDILLDLFVHHAAHKRVSITSACIASAVAPTTGLRWIKVLEHLDLIRRSASTGDRRVNYLELTSAGYLAIGRHLHAMLHEPRVS